MISAYPAREVKKGLENLYKKVEKHLCPHSSLLVVVWRDMQVSIFSIIIIIIMEILKSIIFRANS